MNKTEMKTSLKTEAKLFKRPILTIFACRFKLICTFYPVNQRNIVEDEKARLIFTTNEFIGN